MKRENTGTEYSKAAKNFLTEKEDVVKYLIVVLAVLFLVGCGEPAQEEKTLMETLEGAAEQVTEKVNKEMEDKQ